jgi:hypothetical protein
MTPLASCGYATWCKPWWRVLANANCSACSSPIQFWWNTGSDCTSTSAWPRSSSCPSAGTWSSTSVRTSLQSSVRMKSLICLQLGSVRWSRHSTRSIRTKGSMRWSSCGMTGMTRIAKANRWMLPIPMAIQNRSVSSELKHQRDRSGMND